MPKYVIDPVHSEIEFSVKHLMISTVRGRFHKFDAEMFAEREDFTDAQVWFKADTRSISTGVADRDAHLRSPDFFDVERHPEMTFKSTSVEPMERMNRFMLSGSLMIRGVERPISLTAIYNGSATDESGATKHGFEIVGQLCRKDWGLSFNALSGGGNALVDDKVKLAISVQMTRAS